MAIAFDAASESGAQTGSSVTFAHTCTGSDLLLVVSSTTRDATDADRPVTGITYNAVALTSRITSHFDAQDISSELWSLTNPATGANNIVTTLTAAVTTWCSAGMSFTGVDQTTPTEATGSTQVNGVDPGDQTSITVTVTTLTDGAWVVDSVYGKSDTALTIGADQTERAYQTVNSGGDQTAQSTELKATAGAVSMSWTWATDDSAVGVGLAIKPAASAGTTPKGIFGNPFDGPFGGPI